MVEKALRIKPDDFSALYKILVAARLRGNSGLEPWEQAFEEELYRKLARRLARKVLSPEDLAFARQAFELGLRSGKR